VLVGIGLVGLVARSLGVAGLVLPLLALAGGLLFEALLVGPLWRLLFRFGSRPALTLESCVEDSVEAVTGFDAQGHGLVAVPLDGQIVQILATLTPADRAAGIRVRAGDRVRIEAIDAAHNRCTVTAR
jgi:translation initiation factor IF-1